MRKKVKKAVTYAAAALSGLCNSLLGAGGGILLSLVAGKLSPEDFYDRRDLLATAQAAMIPGCIASALIYGARGELDCANFAVFALPAILGGALGSLLLTKIKPLWIMRIFAALVIFSGIRMIMR